MLRPFDPTRDREAARRIWRETGWLDHGAEKDEAADRWVDAGRALVAEVEGEAECLVLTAPGTLGYLNEDLPLCCVTGVTTSRTARKMGLALRLTARAVAEDAAGGAIVSALGMFEQGFYNKIGFGTGSYEVSVAFDPAHLAIPTSHRSPVRLTKADWQEVHAARVAQTRRHGACTVLASVATRGPMEDGPHRFGLGYRDKDTGLLTHHFWCSPKGERGPYRIEWLCYHTREQFLELMSLIRSIGDQVRVVKMHEPEEVQMQDLMRQPFKQFQISDRSEYAAGITARACYQYRICDLPACMAKTQLPCESVTFNLALTDPITEYLEVNSHWRGAGGDYVVTLGRISSATHGRDTALPTLKSSVGAFTRLWLGVRPATGLAITDDFSAPQELLEKLDHVLRLPRPRNDWDF